VDGTGSLRRRTFKVIGTFGARLKDPFVASSPSATAVLPAPGRDGKEEALVQAMFDRVAPRYDLANAVLSLGQDAHWRRVVAQAVAPAGRVILDVASGPGNVAKELIAHGARRVTALDLSFNMLAEGAKRGIPDVTWVNGDAQSLPFPDAAFDAVTISFGLRNIPDPVRALSEFARVTRPGGTLVVCEFAAPTWSPLREVYLRYLVAGLPRIAQLVSSDASAYTYLAESIQQWPHRRAVADWMEQAGWAGVQVKDLSGGIVALHRGRRSA
jgi:demethylmenaquinone methyltransferase / 2-methoxy-6-polyprenyl-1,4-benzoquinol methylase